MTYFILKIVQFILLQVIIENKYLTNYIFVNPRLQHSTIKRESEIEEIRKNQQHQRRGQDKAGKKPCGKKGNCVNCFIQYEQLLV